MILEKNFSYLYLFSAIQIQRRRLNGSLGIYRAFDFDLLEEVVSASDCRPRLSP